MKRWSRYGRVDPNDPEAAGVCHRGGEIRKRSDLIEEQEWRGGRLLPNGWLVCREHLDKPNPQLGGQLPLPADPAPVRRPSPIVDPAPVYYDLLLAADEITPLLGPDGKYLFAPRQGPLPS